MRLHQRLSAKIMGIGLIFFILLSIFASWRYQTLKSQFELSYQKEASTLAQTISTSLSTFLLETEQGGQLIEDFVIKINKDVGSNYLRVVRSESVKKEYGLKGNGETVSKEERWALIDGKVNTFNSDTHIIYISPVKSVEGCGVCHAKPDNSGQEVEDGYVLGLMVAQIPLAPLKVRMKSLFEETLISILLVAILFIVFGLFIEHSISGPLNSILKVMRKVSSGKLDERIDISAIDSSGVVKLKSDEIGALADGFNEMAGKLEISFSKLEGWAEKLEREVELQTEKVSTQSIEIQKMHDYLTAIVDSSQRIICTTDRNLIIDSVNAQWDIEAKTNSFTTTRKDIIGKNLLDFLPADQREKCGETCHKVLTDNDIDNHHETFEFEINEETRYYTISITPLIDRNKARLGLVIIATDNTERQRAEEQLREEKGKLDAIMNSMGDAVEIVNENREITYINKEMGDTFGTKIVGDNCFQMFGRDTPCKGCDDFAFANTTSLELEANNAKTYLITHSPIKGAGGLRSVVEVFKDITELKKMENELRELTITDNLTLLFNKRHFYEKLQEEMKRSTRQKGTLALLFADIDKFKSFNDTYGHVEGDICLANLGKIIKGCIREHVDSGFRYGGEEFTVILTGSSKELCETIANRIRATFASHKFTPKLDGKIVDVYKTISIGGTVYDGKVSIDNFIEITDHAMYRAKRSGGDRVEIV